VLNLIKFIRIAALIFLTSAAAAGAAQTAKRQIDVVSFWSQQQFDEVAPGGKSAIAINFELRDGWHFYASPDTAPGGMNLKLEPNEQGTRQLTFDNPIWPKAGLFHDVALDKNLDVFSGKFTVYLPFSVSPDANLPAGTKNVDVKISIEGAVCSESQCRVPNFGDIETTIKITRDANNLQPAFVLPENQQAAGYGASSANIKSESYSLFAALVLAFVAGLSLNIMPCVWPVLPIIIMRLVENAKESKGKSIVMGFAFCIGILVFFACLAGANIILHIFYGQVLQWGDQLRNPAFLIAMAMLLIVLALFMFGVFSINLPSSIGGKSGSGQGLGGAIGMGFLAAILSTPCSFGILAAVFAWAQTQPLVPATLAIMIIGIGMATPFLVLTAVPALLKKAPRPGRWMELFKQTIGFVLLVIAVKLIEIGRASCRERVSMFV
jgi:thiol:disulfide interchange protein